MNFKHHIKKIIIVLSFLLFFITIFNGFLSVKLWDSDFWWHISTGKYIVEHKAIPDKDPFISVNNLPENENIHPKREKLVLKMYWLAQVVFYKIYDVFGDAGIIIFRSLILLSLLLIITFWLKRQHVSSYVIYPVIFAVFMGTGVVTGERPVLFTILFTVLTFIILDSYKQKQNRSIFFLIPLMLIWANMHGGFILGNVFILTYIIGETINYVLKRGTLDKKALLMLYGVGLLAIAVSSLNPNVFNALMTVSSENKIFQEGVQEYASPFLAYKLKLRSIDWEYIILLSLFPVIALIRNKKMDIVYYLLLCGLLYMSVSALRFVIYYVYISAIILGREVHYIMKDYFSHAEHKKRIFEYVSAGVIFISSIMFVSGFLNFQNVTFAKSEKFSVPKGAVDFIETHKIEGNIYNSMGFGGYITWRLYPWKKPFIDTRQVNYIVMQEYGWIIQGRRSIKNPVLPEGKTPLWERLLDHYKIDIIVIDNIDVYGLTPQLIFGLVKSDKWIPVYHDLISVIFVRNISENREIISDYGLSDELVYNGLLARLTQMALQNNINPRLLLSMGDIFSHMEKYHDALKAYKYADKRLPNFAATQMRIESTEAFLAKEEMANGEKGAI
jgi:hypothetical protein